MHLFRRRTRTADDRVRLEIADLVVAGWTGRDRAAVEHHIAELAAIGVPRPSATPLFYRLSASLLTNGRAIQVVGADTSGEVETVIVALADGLWVGLGSDHTDRAAESYSVALSKQLCPKPIATELWRLDDVDDHWDRLVLRCWIAEAGERRLYQEGNVGGNLAPRDLIARYAGGAALPPGTAMYCGTMPVQGRIRAAARYELELHDPVLDRRMAHTYEVEALPVVG
ncbi:MAG TPA: DUF2848 domain-containing protein [Candidatus Cybelea sp.]|nr:DUF2848 domain-containing protein [Candidatus Cybelea sp.]